MKIKTMKHHFIIILLILAGMSSPAQEVLTGLQVNPVIRETLEAERADGRHLMSTRAGEPNPLVLPFFEDFSGNDIFPSPGKFIDREIYVNRNFAYRSVNLGVATFDAINSKGYLHQNASVFPFLADSLTSFPIRLDSVFSPVPRPVTLEDSVYFSFFYQPQGIANKPEEWDSLVLEFGYETGNLVFAYYYDSLTLPVSAYILPGETINPGDTVFSPEFCDSGLYVVSNRIYGFDDSITLPCDSVFIPEVRWDWVWSSPGMSLDSFYLAHGTYSRQVMIPVLDTAKYYQPGFRFRFYNIASLASDFNPSWKSNCDQWNVDYIYLDIDRNAGDTVYRDISFAEKAPSLLKRYEAMPYYQYINDPISEIKDELELYITNLDTTIFNTRFDYYLEDEEGLYPYTYQGGFCNLRPFTTDGYQSCVSCFQHACPPFNYVFPLNLGDSALFRIDYVVLGDFTPVDTIGDTLTYHQRFHNYYAYDDGSPEAGYGLTPGGAMLAYRFSLNTRDTLRAVQMYFNHTLNNANEQYFHLKVWRDNNGVPGELIYEEQNKKVEYSGSLTCFHTYMLEEPVPVNGVFYIGWEQINNVNLNLGYDLANDAQANIFYNTSGEWLNSTFRGSLMMRPMLGKEFSIIGIDEKDAPPMEFTVYPNPLRDNTLHIRLSDRGIKKDRLNISIFNMLGQRILSLPFSREIQLPDLHNGIYILHLTDERSGTRKAKRFIINR